MPRHGRSIPARKGKKGGDCQCDMRVLAHHTPDERNGRQNPEKLAHSSIGARSVRNPLMGAELSI